MDRIITRLGLADHEPKVLHDRRGTTVYKIDNIALKIASGLMAAREGEILHLLGTDFYRDHGWDEMVGAAQELAKLHAAGWVHGDLQPDHVIIEGEAMRIIDLELLTEWILE